MTTRCAVCGTYQDDPTLGQMLETWRRFLAKHAHQKQVAL